MKSITTFTRWSFAALVLLAACTSRPIPSVPVPANWPANVLPGYDYTLSVMLIDGGGDMVACRFDWGDSTMSDWTAPVPSGSLASASHRWQTAGTYRVRLQARNVHGIESRWSGPAFVVVGDTHPVLWSLRLGPDAYTTSPVVVPGAGSDVVYLGTGWYVLGCDSRGVRRFTAQSVDLDSEDTYFNTAPAFCAATGHIMMAHQEGELYAFTTALDRAWHWPGNWNRNMFDYTPWTSFAVDGNLVYAGHENDELYPALHCIEDLGDHGVAVARCSLPAIDDELLRPPAVGPDGNVIIATDYHLSAYSPRLERLLWVAVADYYEVYDLAIGPDGTIYCATDFGTIAYGPDGEMRWREGDDEPAGLVLDDSLLYIAGFDGSVCARTLGRGMLAWRTEPDTSSGSNAAPLLAANGVLYVLDDIQQALHCYNRPDGVRLWTTALPGAGLYSYFDDIGPQLSITSSGDIIVASDSILYCVQGYPDGQLANAPWPKWQHDVYNTGCARMPIP